MTWLAWRQFRANAAFASIATVAVVALLASTRGHIADVVGSDARTPTYDSIRLLGTALIGAPAFVGAFWGAPLVARELESGTHRLVWTQSITRRRWLLVKVGIAALAAVVAIGTFSLVLTWWSAPFDELGNRIGTANFGQRGVAPVAYALFALALGTFAGTALRRTVPAMGATLLGFFVVRYGFQRLVRPGLVDPVTATLPNNSFGQRAEQTVGTGGWIMSSHTVDASGRTLSPTQVDTLVNETCRDSGDGARTDTIGCIDRIGLHDVVEFHPGSHFWALQLWESAVFVALAAALVAGCLWWLGHRTP